MTASASTSNLLGGERLRITIKLREGNYRADSKASVSRSQQRQPGNSVTSELAALVKIEVTPH
jgi:hypothetical protein